MGGRPSELAELVDRLSEEHLRGLCKELANVLPDLLGSSRDCPCCKKLIDFLSGWLATVEELALCPELPDRLRELRGREVTTLKITMWEADLGNAS